MAHNTHVNNCVISHSKERSVFDSAQFILNFMCIVIAIKVAKVFTLQLSSIHFATNCHVEAAS